MREPGPIAGHPLELLERPVPEPAPGEEFLILAARLGIRPETTVYPFEHAARALEYLSVADVRGAGVLRVAERR